MATCNICFTKPAYTITHADMFLCIACYDELQELSCMESSPTDLNWSEDAFGNSSQVSSLFWYSGPVRQQIINAKVKGDVSSLAGILKIWHKETEDLPILKHIDGVMPCPSSLWSRLHGKIDIAWFLAAHLSRTHKIKLVLPPRRIQWNLKKRAHTHRPVDNSVGKSVDNPVEKPLIAAGEQRERYLVVDDVVTTGSTLKVCMQAAGSNKSLTFHALTFARAR